MSRLQGGVMPVYADHRTRSGRAYRAYWLALADRLFGGSVPADCAVLLREAARCACELARMAEDEARLDRQRMTLPRRRVEQRRLRREQRIARSQLLLLERHLSDRAAQQRAPHDWTDLRRAFGGDE